MKRAFILAIAFGCVCAQTEQQSARERLQDLQKQSLAARQAGEVQKRIGLLEQIRELLNDAPNVLDKLAQANAAAGKRAKADEIVSEMAEMGVCDQAWLNEVGSLFATQQLGRVRRNCEAVARSSLIFSLPDPGLVAEDIDYDAARGKFLITSVLEKKIVRVDRSGRTTGFAKSPSGWPMLGLKIDQKHGVVWATEVALDGFANVPKQDWGRSAVLMFDLADGSLRGRVEGPRPAALGDIALLADGAVLASDGLNGRLYRIAPEPAKMERMQRVDNSEFISPQTAVAAPDGKHVLVPDYARGIGVLDLASRSVAWVDPQRRFALSGIDGLYLSGNSLFATQNGTTPERVIRFDLSPDLRTIRTQQVIERATSTLGDPTHGVVLGHDFYYIANSGWSEIDDHGIVKDGHKLTSARVMRAPVSQ